MSTDRIHVLFLLQPRQHPSQIFRRILQRLLVLGVVRFPASPQEDVPAVLHLPGHHTAGHLRPSGRIVRPAKLRAPQQHVAGGISWAMGGK